jgi:DNA polymerase III subunit delta
VTYQSLISDLKTGKFKAIYLLHGEEAYFIDKITDFFENHLLEPHEKDFNLCVLYGSDTDVKRVVDELMQYPMMAKYRVVIVKEAQNLKNIADLEKYCARAVPHSILVLAHKYKKLDKRTKFAKSLTDHKHVVFESKTLYDNQVPDWIKSIAAEKSLKLDPKAPQMLADFLGTELSRISNELDKLLLSFGTQNVISLDDIREQIGVSREFNVFELQKALGQRDYFKSVLIARYMAENSKNNPIQLIIGSLFTYFVKLYITAQNYNLPKNDLMKLLGLSSPYFLNEYLTAAKMYSPDHLKKTLLLLRDTDLMSKGVSNRRSNDGELLKELVNRILT